MDRMDKLFFLKFLILGIVGAGVILVRTETSPFIIACILYCGIQDWRRGRFTGSNVVVGMFTSIVMVFLLWGPYLVYCNQKYGHPLNGINQHARFWRDGEFGLNAGKMNKKLDGIKYSRTTSSPYEYIVMMHGIGEIVNRFGRGYVNLFEKYFHLYTDSFSVIPMHWSGSSYKNVMKIFNLYGFDFLGVCIVLIKGPRVILLLMIAMTFTVAFILPFGVSGRFVAHVQLWYFILVAVGIAEIYRRVRCECLNFIKEE